MYYRQRRDKKNRKTISLLIVIILFLLSLIIMNKYLKKYDVEILIGCSDICSLLNISKVNENYLNELIKNFKSVEIRDHPIYNKKLKTEIILPSNYNNENNKILKIFQNSIVKVDPNLNNKIQIVLGLDNLQFFSIPEYCPKSIFVIDRNRYGILKNIIYSKLDGNTIVVEGDKDIKNFDSVYIKYPSYESVNEDLRKIFLGEKVKEEKSDDIPLKLIIVPPISITTDFKDTQISWILIRKREYKLYFYKGSELIKIYKIGIGKNSGDKKAVGDYRTPEGYFYIKNIYDSREWTHDFGDGKGPIKGAYGPWYLDLYTGADRTKSGISWEGIGIHGTHDPSSIGKSISEGCIRLFNEDIMELKENVDIGTPVIIEP